jgi:vancomycin resistance protein VanJ
MTDPSAETPSSGRRAGPGRAARPARSNGAAAATLAAAAFVGLSVVHAVAPQRAGLLALSQIFAPHLFLVMLLVVPLALVRGGRAARIILALALLVGGVRFGPGLVSLPPAVPSGAATLAVTSWNLEAGEPSLGALLGGIRTSTADVVVLQELTPMHADALADDPSVHERFPYFVFRDKPGVTGIGVISRHRILESSWLDDPALLHARLDVAGRAVDVVTVHPLPAVIGGLGVIPVEYDPSRRDAAFRTIRTVVDPLLASGAPLVLAGDFNVTDREPGYGDVSAGLRDAFAEAGVGLGATWRPSSVEWLPFGLLRIDHLFSSPGVRPTAYRVDCSPRASDHCIVSATFEL